MNSKTTSGGRGNQRVTLRTIAEVTGLSLSTVSLSLRGGTTLKQEAVGGGYVTEAEFDAIVRPEQMIGPD